jgi:hypothetical protein
MSQHFQKCVELKGVILPYCDDVWEKMNVNERQTIYAELIKKQVNRLQGQRFAIVCMSRISYYDTLEAASLEFMHLNQMFCAQLYYPSKQEP